MKENQDRYRELQDYLGLESLEQAKLFDILESEFLQMGEWGSKIITYLRSILSRNKRYRTYIQESDQELLKKVLSDGIMILSKELKQHDSIQGKNSLDPE